MNRIIKRMTLALLGPALLVVGLASPAAASGTLTSNAARSVVVTMKNDTPCLMELYNFASPHGEFIPGGEMPRSVMPGATVQWGTESNGFMTGTEAWGEFTMWYCGLNYALVHFHWNNPYVGSNSYDTNGTDYRIGTPRSGGSGNNAQVFWRVCLKNITC
ncbi:MAG TPA: hypothetical protein VGJ63_10870 [Micromonosporaceae bacterium]|jgi:hypothetical protein